MIGLASLLIDALSIDDVVISSGASSAVPIIVNFEAVVGDLIAIPLDTNFIALASNSGEQAPAGVILEVVGQALIALLSDQVEVVAIDFRLDAFSIAQLLEGLAPCNSTDDLDAGSIRDDFAFVFAGQTFSSEGVVVIAER